MANSSIAFQDALRQSYGRVCECIINLDRLTNLRNLFVIQHSNICQKSCIFALPTYQAMVDLKQQLHDLSLKMARKLREPKWRTKKLSELNEEAQPLILIVKYMDGYITAIVNVHLLLLFPNVRC